MIRKFNNAIRHLGESTVLLRAVMLILCIIPMLNAKAQHVALKTNLFYGAYAKTPNLGLEIALGNKSTLEFNGSFNPWNLKGTFENNKKLVHWLGQIEYKFWLCSKFNGHFFGLHALGSQFNISGHELPLLFGKGSENYRYEGWGAGAGISYGYSFYLGKHWGLELSVGAGYVRLNYDKFDCVKCGDRLSKEVRNYFGPTKAAVSLVYIIK